MQQIKGKFTTILKKTPLCLWILIFFAFTSSYAQTTQKITLDGAWAFKIDPYSEGEKSGWANEYLNTSTWDSLQVPGNWDLINEYAEYTGDAWYSRTFTIDNHTDLQQVRIVFQSVYHDSKIWINGNLVGENQLGFLPFHFDISKYIKPKQENRITVLVNNVFKRGAMWNWGGIRRPVWLEVTSPVRLEYQHVDAIPDLTKGTADIKLKIVSSNAGKTAKNVTLQIKIQRKDKVVIADEMLTTIPPNTSQHEVIWSYTLPKSNVELWHYDFPNLYTATVGIFDSENKEIHRIADRFGIRKLEVKGLELLLNGERIRPVGFNIVPEDRFTGNTLPMERIKEDVDLMKSLGVNMARLSHVALPKEYLDYLDEKGIMVFEEVGLWGKDTWVDPDHPMPKEWLQRMVKEKYNHPSVVGWSIGNEIGDESKNPKVNDYVKGAILMAKALDPNRLAVYVSHTAQKNPNDAIVYSDLAMINAYGGWGQAVDRTWEYHKKPIFISEFGNVLSDEDPNLGEIPVKKMMNTLRNKDYVLGTSLWTFNDYRSTYHGVAGWKTPPSQNRAWGVVTTFRDKKRAFYEIQREYAPIKNLSISTVDKIKQEALIIIQPRGLLDIPANVLRGYSLRWSVLNQDFYPTVVETQKVKLINPGDEQFEILINWENQSSVKGLKVEFMNPQGYIVFEETKYFEAPKQPAIKFANTSTQGVRILFDQADGTSEHLVKYYYGGSTFFTPPSINNFIDILDERIKQGVAWKYQLIALNNAGQSIPSSAKELKMDEDELPPVIWNVKRTEHGVFIGFSVAADDYLYEVEYGTNAGQYTKKLTTKVKGVLNIPNMTKGEPIYFRMRVRKQWGFASEWTHELKI